MDGRAQYKNEIYSLWNRVSPTPGVGAVPLFERVFAADRNWIELTSRLARVGIIPDDPALLRQILQATRDR